MNKPPIIPKDSVWYSVRFALVVTGATTVALALIVIGMAIVRWLIGMLL